MGEGSAGRRHLIQRISCVEEQSDRRTSCVYHSSAYLRMYGWLRRVQNVSRVGGCCSRASTSELAAVDKGAAVSHLLSVSIDQSQPYACQLTQTPQQQRYGSIRKKKEAKTTTRPPSPMSDDRTCTRCIRHRRRNACHRLVSSLGRCCCCCRRLLCCC